MCQSTADRLPDSDRPETNAKIQIPSASALQTPPSKKKGLNATENMGREILSVARSEEHTSELQSLMRISYAVFCLKKKKNMNIMIKKVKITKYKIIIKINNRQPIHSS